MPKLPRLFYLFCFNLALFALIHAIAPQQTAVTLYKLSLVTLGGLVAYWLDRALFPYARPDTFLNAWSLGAPPMPNREWVFVLCMLRRAIIIAAAMLAMGLGA